ncbi:hypothetical protein E2C01_100233 [Portunus trituberculatus]|uniref:Ig-like domain-containing protein n=1 Tax=Portunus trituberculatus TaxID=210409 RepID=A0A5B7KGV3_PORTR|nr:hypothetical protein [Portunus trituberculatus]
MTVLLLLIEKRLCSILPAARPTSVVIKAPADPLVEGRKTRLECVAAGAYPSAVISWDMTIAGRSKLLKSTVSKALPAL